MWDLVTVQRVHTWLIVSLRLETTFMHVNLVPKWEKILFKLVIDAHLRDMETVM